MSIPVVLTFSALEDLARELSLAQDVVLDAEGDGLYRYRTRLCTLQLAAGERAFVVDPLALEDLSPLAPLLGEAGPRKVIHDVSFDARVLGARGLALGNVFDTSITARYLAEPATGLASLLARHLEVTLDKELQQADWGQRPLDEARLAYLLADVVHLRPLAEILEGLARERDILEEIDEETRYALARAREPEADTVRAPYTRIKGYAELAGPHLALLAALAAVREEEAERADVPPFRIAPNAALFEAARRTPRSPRELGRIRGMRGLSDEALARALERAEREGPPAVDAPAAPPREVRAREKARERALTELRRAEATRREVDPQVVLPGHCLRELVALEDLDGIAQVAGLGAKRLALYGERIREALRAAKA